MMRSESFRILLSSIPFIFCHKFMFSKKPTRPTMKMIGILFQLSLLLLSSSFSSGNLIISEVVDATLTGGKIHGDFDP
jgi:hypothetical protein